MKTRYTRTLVLVTAALLLSACGGQRGAASDQPANFGTYVYPGGLFTLSMPPDWVVNDISDAAAVHVEFSPPGSQHPQLIVFAVRMESPATDFDASVDDYVRLFYDDERAPFKEVAREAQPDGSLRLSGVVQLSLIHI